MKSSPFILKKTLPGSTARLKRRQTARAKARQFHRPELMKQRREATKARERQAEGFESSELFKLTVLSKLLELRPTVVDRLADSKRPVRWFENYERCGQETIYRICLECQRVKELPYNCNLKWCPRCNWRIAAQRRRLLEKMTHGLTSCKHVVLTQRNTANISREMIRENAAALAKLRRLSVFGVVHGGCSSTEFTNEGHGWHMHNHLLIESDFIDARILAREWGRLVGQSFAIVKVKALSEKSYLQEICKYAVDGSVIAGWTGEQIFEFIAALRGTRLFRTFGTFNALRKAAAVAVKQEKPAGEPCACGCQVCIIAPTEQMAQAMWRKEWGMK
jgi:hypothetical protein